MRIVILDGYATNPGDLSWAEIQALGECAIFDRTPPEDVIKRARDAEIVLTNKALVDRTAIEALPCLRYIGVLATGYNIVDIEAARERGIPVSNVPEYSTAAVAQMVFALLLELTHQVGEHSRSVREGGWSASPDFSYCLRPLLELQGLKMGILGYGRIGRRVAAVAAAFGMAVQASRRDQWSGREKGVDFVDLETLLQTSDVVSLHCPLTPATEGLIDAQRLGWMKPGAYLINTARGPLVVEEALAAALNEGRIAGAGLDVLSTEPPAADHPLLTARHCVITPHQAWATWAARQRLLQAAAENIRAFLAGNPLNVVNP